MKKKEKDWENGDYSYLVHPSNIYTHIQDIFIYT